MNFDGESESGVNKKIKYQIKWLNDYGIDANFVLIGDYNKINSKNPDQTKIPTVSGKRKNIISRLD